MTRDDGFDVDMKNIEIADYPRVPDADYEAVCFKAEGPTEAFGPKGCKIYLHFRIISDGEHHGKELYLPLNYSDRHGNRYKKIPLGSNLYAALRVAYGDKKISGKLKNLRIFKNAAFRIRTRTIKRNKNQTDKPEDAWYSVVDHLIERTAG